MYSEADVPEQDGKTVLVTGANTGIGFEAARVLAERGARVLLGCRSEEKAALAIANIQKDAPDTDIAWLELDLASLASVREAAAQVQSEPRLDLLINNAGVMMPPKSLTEDNFELQFGVNHLGHFALTGLLLTMLKEREGARIVNVSSLAHRGGRINYADINADLYYNRMERYAMSKFANILFTYELQRRLEAAGSPAISVACHPGGSNTELGRNLPVFMQLMAMPLQMFMNSAAEGALPTLMAATGEGVNGGDYFGPAGFGEFSRSATKVSTIPHSRSETDAARLWDLSTEMTGVTYEF